MKFATNRDQDFEHYISALAAVAATNYFQTMETEKLIMIMQNKEILWNLKNPDYKNYKKKISEWHKVSAQMGYSVDDCKRKWKSLRDSFCRESNKRLKLDQGADELSERWRFFEQMSFLKPHIQSRKYSIIGNYSSSDYSDKMIDQSANSDDTQGSDDLLPSERLFIIDQPVTKQRLTASNGQTNSSLRPHKRKIETDIKFETELVPTMASIENYVDDEDELFCKLIITKLKKFPLKLKNEMKVKILVSLNEQQELLEMNADLFLKTE